MKTWKEFYTETTIAFAISKTKNKTYLNTMYVRCFYFHISQLISACLTLLFVSISFSLKFLLHYLPPRVKKTDSRIKKRIIVMSFQVASPIDPYVLSYEQKSSINMGLPTEDNDVSLKLYDPITPATILTTLLTFPSSLHVCIFCVSLLLNWCCISSSFDHHLLIPTLIKLSQINNGLLLL